MLKISELKNLSIIQIVQYKGSKININDIKIEGLENPTSENLIKWIWQKIENDFKGLYKIKLSEDHGTGIIYKGE